METYPNQELNNVSYKLFPWFRETIQSQCDLAYHTKKITETYPDLDHSMVPDTFWFLDTYIPLKDAPV